MANHTKQNTPLLVRGSVVKVKRTCGKQGCRCVLQGKLHETWALSYSYRGRTRMVPLGPKDVAAARKAINRYKKQLARLQAQALDGIKRLHAIVKASKRGGL